MKTKLVDLSRVLTTIVFALMICPAAWAQFPVYNSFNDASRNDANGMPSWMNTFSHAVPQFTSLPSSNGGTTLRSDWSLGAYVRHIDIGAELTEVIAGSSAERFGLKRGDIIVAAGGYQVGYIGSKLYDVTEEIRKRVDPQTGRVSVLVFDGRERQLRNIPFDLNATETGIAGEILIRENPLLGSDAVLEVQLRNLTTPYQDVFGGRTISRISGTGPYPFKLRIDPSYIDPRHQYQLTATVSVGGQPMYFASQSVSPPSAGRVTTAKFILERVGVVQAGTVTQTGYPPDQLALSRLFQQYLNRPPMPNELQAWTDFLAKGRSIEEAKASLLASPQFYELASNDPVRFIQRMYQVSGLQASQQDVQRWLAKLQQYQGARALLAQEFLSQVR